MGLALPPATETAVVPPANFIKFPVFQNVPAPPNVLHVWLFYFTESAEYRKETKSTDLRFTEIAMFPGVFFPKHVERTTGSI